MKHWLSLLFICLAITSCSSTQKTEEEQLKALAMTPAETCHQAADINRPQFVIGYGSLMQKGSRLRSAPDTEIAYAGELQGFRRGWFTHGSSTGFSTTFLGVVPESTARMNAAVIPVSIAGLEAFDKREKSYCRKEIDPAQIRLLGSINAPEKAQFWIYSNQPDNIALPDSKLPLVQSYIDIFISGCLELEEQYLLEGFAAQCISTTTNWSGHWVNDRLYPRRPFIHQPRAWQIDQLLEEHVRQQFRQIRIE